MFAAFQASGQLIKSSGVLYFDAKTNLDTWGEPASYGGELAVTLDSMNVWKWDGVDQWVKVVDIFQGSGVPVGDPGESSNAYLDIDSGMWYRWNGSTWVVSGGSVADLDDLGDVILTTPATGEALIYNGTEWRNAGVSGSGDMLKSVFDPTNVNGDAFDMDNMSEGTTNKILTGTERTNISNNTTHAGLTTGNPHNVTATDVGLGNVDNTSDANKPISTATQTALNGKSNTGHAHTESDITDLDHYTTTDFNTDLSTKTSDDITEGATNLYYPAADAAKLAAIEAGATADQTASEVNITDAGGYYTGGNVEAALSEIADTLESHLLLIGTGGGGTWGSITGTLSDQTDLQSALNAKANTSHAHTESDITDLDHFTGADITGSETAFTGWDKNAADDFDGNYSSLTGAPTIPIIDGTAYGASWSGNTDGATKGALYTKIEALVSGAADGNGLFDNSNDGGAVTAGFNFSITDSLTVGLVKFGSTGNIWDVGTLNGHTIPGGAGTLALTSQLHDAVTLSGAPDYITLSGQVITRGLIDLTTDVTGLLPGANINTITESQISDFGTYLETEVDGSVSNEGSLTVGAGTGTTSIINSNTSGSTGVTIEAGTGLSIAEAGSTITLTNTVTDTDTQLTQEQVEDYAGALIIAGSHSLISTTYNDAGGNVQLDVESDLSLYDNGTSGFLSSEVDGSTTNEIQNVDTLVLSAGVLGVSLSSDGVAQKTVGLISTDGGNTITAGADGKLYSAAGAGESTTVSDGNTIDLTLTGSDIDGEVIIDPSGTNILSASVSGLLATEVDGSTTNEIQTIDVSSFDGTNVSLSLSSDGEATKTIDISSVVNTSRVTSAGALMDSEVDADLKTLSLPASTTISVFGASLIDDSDAATARTTLDVDQAGTDNSTNVSLLGTPDYITIAGQVITRGQIDLTTDVTGLLPGANINTITASQVSDFDTEVANNSAVTANTAKVSNVSTSLSTGNITATTYGVTSDGGTDDVVLVEATTSTAGLLGSGKWNEIVANTAKVSNVSTALSVGTVNTNTVSITSDGGADDVTLPAATVSTAGMLTTAKWSEIVANTAKVTNATHTGDVTGSGALTVDKTAITGKTAVTAATGDYVLISDVSDSGNLKKALVSDFQDGTGTDDQTAAEVSITDAGLYYTGTDVEAALQEIGSDLAGVGDVVGPGSSVDERVARFDGTTGKLLQVSNVQINDASDILGVSALSLTGNINMASLATVDGRDLSVDGSKLDGIEAGANVTNTTSVTAAGALMDSEVDADLKTFSLPANATMTTFGESIIDDPDAATARTTLDVDQAGTDNSTNVTLAGTPDYITITGQTITLGLVNLTTDVAGVLPQTNFAVTGNWTGTFDGAEGTAYLARANHTGTQAASTISDFDTEVANNSAVAANTAKILTAYKTADESVTSDITLNNDADLVIAVEANSVYRLSLELITNAHATPDLDFDFSIPSGATLYTMIGTNGTIPIPAGTEINIKGSGIDLAYPYYGYVKTSATAGNVQFKWAQSISDANATTVKLGTSLILTKLN